MKLRRLRLPHALVTTCCLVASLGPSCSQPPAGRAKNVVLVCLDTVRADHLGCYGYAKRETTPALDALASESTVFVDASATACWTKPSVPSILTGLYPIQHGVYRGSARDASGVHSDVLPDRARTLAEVFQERGYATAAFVENSQLRSGLGFEQGFDAYHDDVGNAQVIRWQASDWLDARDEDRPFFLYLHMLDAHWPYSIPDESAARFASPEAVARFRSRDWRKLRDAINDGELELTAGELDELVALYDGALRFIDGQLERLFAKLERESLMDDTIVCIVSDHGEEFLEHGVIGHGHELYEALLRVPWILYVPGREARRVEGAVSLIDVFPTVLAAAGIAADAELPGVDRLRAQDEARAIVAEHLKPSSYSQTLRSGTLKVTRRLAADPDAPVQLSAASFKGRWEAKVEPTDGGGLRATRLRRGEEEDEEDPVEIKGPIEGLGAEHFELDGMAVAFDDLTKLYGETQAPDGAERVLTAGMLVKIKGAFDGAGVFQAQRIKLYAADDEIEREIRGPISDVSVADEAAGTLRIGGIPVLFDERTEIEGTKNVLPRSVVLPGSGEALLPRSSRLFELHADPLEARPAEADARARELLGDLDAWQAALAAGRIWRAGDREALSDSDLEALRAIGYAD